MTQQNSDLLIDRKRLKSQLSSWRVVALVAIFGSFAFFFSGTGPHKKISNPRGDYIAQLNIEGMIVDDAKRDELMKRIKEDNRAKAVLVRFDSPGGTTVGGEEVFIQLREIAKKKPVVGVMHTLCASACYMASLGTDHVVAREGTLTGSIGVYMQSVEVSRLAERFGITPITIKSGPNKDSPSLTEPFTPEQRKVVQELITDAYERFVGMIVARRKLDPEKAHELSDGRVYTGAQAAKLDLIDGLGGNDEALAWLAEKHKINPELELRETKPDTEYESLMDKLGQATGLKIFTKSAIGLDGLISLWHPSVL